MPRTPTALDPLLHAGRALFAAIRGDEAGLEGALHTLLALDRDGRHRRWAVDEVAFAPFRARAWFAALCAAPVVVVHAGSARAQQPRARMPR